MTAAFSRKLLGIGLVTVLLGACATPTAVLTKPDGSRERPYPHPRQAAEHVVSVALDVLAQYRGHQGGTGVLRVDVVATEDVSRDVVDAVRAAVSRAGITLTAGDEWLATVVDVQNRLQGIAYAPAPVAGLTRADIVLAIDEKVAGPDLRQVRGALLTLRARDAEWTGAGDVVRGSAVSAFVGAAPSPGEARWLKVSGTGFCNRRLPEERWEYTAITAAQVAARAELARARCGEAIEAVRRTSFGALDDDRIIGSAQCTVKATKTVAQEFDESSCRAVVALTDGQAPPGAEHVDVPDWFSIVSSFTVKVLFGLTATF